jgi:hypothetical protein
MSSRRSITKFWVVAQAIFWGSFLSMLLLPMLMIAHR